MPVRGHGPAETVYRQPRRKSNAGRRARTHGLGAYNRRMPHDPIYRLTEVRALEAGASPQPLMERAGLAAAEVARELLAARPSRVLVLAGPGNNGGDAFVVARWLKSWFFDVVVAFRGDAAKLANDAAAAHRQWIAGGGTTIPEWRDGEHWGLIVDGLFGIGLTRPIEGEYAHWIARANDAGVPILALDVPSGLDAETGAAHGVTIRAAATATFIALKPGLLTADGPDHCGAISVHALDLEVQSLVPARGKRLTWASLAAALPQPLLRAQQNVHKGSFGTLAIVGGNDGMVGAAILAGRAALHLGAGKVWVGLATNTRPAVDWVQPELMLRAAEGVLADQPDALVIGPGLGTGARARELLVLALAQEVPLVLDADALNLIAGDATLAAATAARKAPTAITPHPAEGARLSGTSTSAIQVDRLSAALALAAKFNAATVLKGAGSVVAFPDGTWAINASGNAGLASGGTGDVLTGMLGALLAQGVQLKDALELVVCLHGAAADALVAGGVGPLGLTASELAPAARHLINRR
jgi:ADP-dependent NAD(P)H-hydrate dehydratase / NAD(P)H-hydrate epimerase